MSSINIGDYKYENIYANDAQVTAIDKTKSSYDAILSNVTIDGVEYSVTSIHRCFLGCTSLTTAPEIPSSVTNMRNCFQNCTSLTTAPEIPSGVTDMRHCFLGCTSLATAPEIPSSVTDMSYCFYGCTSLITASEIPSGVTNMSYCFQGCSALTTAPEIPSGITDMERCFQGCSDLTNIIITHNNPTSIDYIFALTSNPIYIVPKGDQDVIDAWTNIADEYSNVYILDTQNVQGMSFYSGDYLYTITDNDTLSAKVIHKNKSAYGALESLVLPNKRYDVIDMAYCFLKCTSLTTAPEIPSGVIDMNDCFYHCLALTTAPKIPSGVTNMDRCFRNCTSLLTAPEIPSSVTSMERCFQDCSALNGNIKMNGVPTSIVNVFAGTSFPIYIINATNPKDESVSTGLRLIASKYSNIHFEADDHVAPVVSLSGVRTNNTGSPSASGDYVTLTKRYDYNSDFLPEGWEISLTESIKMDNQQEVPLIPGESGKPIKLIPFEIDANQHLFTYTVNDGYKITTQTLIVTKSKALLDFLGYGSQGGYIDLPGMGMAIGKSATRNGLDIEFPTTIGLGLLPPYKINGNNKSVDLDNYQLVIGQYNLQNNTDIFIVGNGDNDNNRSNAFTINKQGSILASGDITDGKGNILANKVNITDLANYLPLTGGTLTGALNGTNINISGNIYAQGMAGMIQMFAGVAEPAGWKFCNGQVLKQSDYPELFAVIETTYNDGTEASTDFRLPDLRGRFPLGIGDGTATGHTNHTLNEKDGNENLIVPSHNHTIPGYWSTGSGGSTAYMTTGNRSRESRYTGTTGSSAIGANMPPYIGLNFIICTGKTS